MDNGKLRAINGFFGKFLRSFRHFIPVKPFLVQSSILSGKNDRERIGWGAYPSSEFPRQRS